MPNLRNRNSSVPKGAASQLQSLSSSLIRAVLVFLNAVKLFVGSACHVPAKPPPLNFGGRMPPRSKLGPATLFWKYCGHAVYRSEIISASPELNQFLTGAVLLVLSGWISPSFIICAAAASACLFSGSS